jgi:mRNA-degrading endonuclease RelE of RelBE toxin-antitoxin system
MNAHITDKFRKAFAELPADVQKQARQAYRLFIENPHHSSLRFKSIHSTRPIYSVRIGRDYRAVGIREEMTSFGIGLVLTLIMTS